MKCPRCGNEMALDSHRKIPFQMCYKCGYIEGRNYEKDETPKATNFSHMKTLNLNELAAFMSAGLDVPEERIVDWLTELSET